MKKTISSRAIIIKDNKLVTLFRRKKKDNVIKEYYSLPGGKLEKNETIEECIIREVKEELCVDVKILKFINTVEYENSIEYYFHCEIINGEPKLGGEELERLNENNYYEVNYLDLDKLDQYDIYSKDMIKSVIKDKLKK